jgi:hypothetical protein
VYVEHLSIPSSEMRMGAARLAVMAIAAARPEWTGHDAAPLERREKSWHRMQMAGGPDPPPAGSCAQRRNPKRSITFS